MNETTLDLIILSGQTKDDQIGVCHFSVHYTVLRSGSKDWLAGIQDSTPKSTCGLISVECVCYMVFNATFFSIFQLYRGGQFYWWREPESLTNFIT